MGQVFLFRLYVKPGHLVGKPIYQVNIPCLLKTLFWLHGHWTKKKNLSSFLGWAIPWLQVNMLTEPSHFHETSQPSKQVKILIQSETAKYVLNYFMKQTNSFTEASQLRLGKPASFNQLLRFFPLIKVWVLDNTEWSWSFSMQAISQLAFTCSKSKIETLGKGVKYVQS